MKTMATTKSLLRVGGLATLGVLAVNAALYWRSMGFGVSIDILTLGTPVVAFTWLSLAGASAIMHFVGHQGKILAAAGLILVHVAALLYFLFAASNGREGAEYARLFAIQLTLTVLILCVCVLKPLLSVESTSAVDAKTTMLLLWTSVVAAAALLYYLLHLCAYYFWLTNQSVDGREDTERTLYFCLAALCFVFTLECVVVWKLLKRRGKAKPVTD